MLKRGLPAGSRYVGPLCASAALWVAAAPQLHAQALEHYAPLAPLRPAAVDVRIAPAPPPVALPAETPLAGIHIVSAGGIESALPDLNGDAWTNGLLGRPMSPALLQDIEDAVQQRYAALHYAVLARWAPENDATTGVVTIAVSRMTLGKVTVTGGRGGQSAYVQSRLVLQPGQPVDSRRFAYDLAGLNRYPYRETAAVFTPRQGSDVADLDLIVTNHKPWEAYAGFKYGGSDHFTFRRYFAGATVGNLLGHDSLLSAQLTGSPDVALHGTPHPKFKEGVVSYSLPVARHAQFEASLDISELNFHFAPSVYRIIDTMAQAGMRLDIPARPGVSQDIRFGIEAKNELEIIFTDGVQGTRMAAEVLQAYAGYHRAWTSGHVQDDLDIVAHLSPGNLDPGNTSRHAAIYSEGRQKSQTYAYVGLTYDRTQVLTKALSWHSQVIGQVATGPVPFSEQPGLGGLSNVRGYYFIDGSYDTSLVVRNELVLRRGPKPYLFYDCGAGRDYGLHHSDVIASAGVGANFKIGKAATFHIEALRTLRAGQFTRKNTDTVLGNLTFRF